MTTNVLDLRAFRLMFGGCPEHNATAHWQWACLVCPASRCYAYESPTDNHVDVRKIAENHVLTQHGAGALPRMRSHRGSAMHIVRETSAGRLLPLCRTIGSMRLGKPYAVDYTAYWTSERGSRPDCQRCTEVAS